jgi:hypothetical protein
MNIKKINCYLFFKYKTPFNIAENIRVYVVLIFKIRAWNKYMNFRGKQDNQSRGQGKWRNGGEGVADPV